MIGAVDRQPALAPASGDPPLAERLLGPGDLGAVLALHAAAHRAATMAGLFVQETPAFFAAHLGTEGEILGLEAPDGTLACYAVLGLPAAEAAGNFGLALGLGSADRARVCHLDGVAVAPAWRGRGLQRRMTRARLARGAAAGRDIALSTAALHNRWSLANLTAENLRVVALVDRYDALRLILRHDPDPVPAGAPARLVALDGQPGPHHALLDAGWQGVAVHAVPGGSALVYRRTSGDFGGNGGGR